MSGAWQAAAENVVCAWGQVAGKMGSAELKYQAAKPTSHQEIFRSCREAEMSYHDPTIMHKLALQIAIAEDRFDDACACAPVFP